MLTDFWQKWVGTCRQSQPSSQVRLQRIRKEDTENSFGALLRKEGYPPYSVIHNFMVLLLAIIYPEHLLAKPEFIGLVLLLLVDAIDLHEGWCKIKLIFASWLANPLPFI